MEPERLQWHAHRILVERDIVNPWLELDTLVEVAEACLGLGKEGIDVSIGVLTGSAAVSGLQPEVGPEVDVRCPAMSL